MRPFKVELIGDFYTHTLYNKKGQEVFSLQDAVQAAEDCYEDGWAIVYNGDQALTRDEVPDSWKK